MEENEEMKFQQNATNEVQPQLVSNQIIQNDINSTQLQTKNNQVKKLNAMSQIGILVFNLALIAFVFSVCSFLSPIITLFYYLILLCIILCIIILTLGLIFVAAPKVVPNLWKLLVNGGEFLSKVSSHLINALPYIVGVSLALSAMAFILFLINRKKQKHTVRFSFSIVFAIISAVSLVLMLA